MLNKGFTVLDLIGGRAQPAAGQDGYTDIVLDINDIIVSNYNKYSMEDIQGLATSIEMSSGVQEPLVLGRVNGQYWLISGHRRREALLILVGEGKEEYRRVPCRYRDMTETQFRIELLSGNTFNRIMTDYDLMVQAAEWKEVLNQAKKEGLLVLEKGERIRDYVARILEKPTGKIGQLNKIQESATEEIKELFKAGDIGITAANAVSGLEEEGQAEIVQAVTSGRVTRGEEIVRMAEELKREKGQDKGPDQKPDQEVDVEPDQEDGQEPDRTVERQRRQQVSDSDTTAQEEENARRLHLLKRLESYYTYLNEEEVQILSGMLEDCKRRKREYSLYEDCGSTM